MALPEGRSDREYDKFTTDDNGDTVIRLVGVSATLPGGTFESSRSAREYKKFVEDDSGDVAVLFSGV